MRFDVSLAVLSAVALIGCKSGSPGAAPGDVSATSSSVTTKRVRRDDSVLSVEEVKAAKLTNAYEAVEQLRPRWLRTRGRKIHMSVGTSTDSTGAMESGAVTGMEENPQPTVFLDTQPVGRDPGLLRRVTVQEFTQLRYLNGPEATVRFGKDYGTGIIMVIRQ